MIDVYHLRRSLMGKHQTTADKNLNIVRRRLQVIAPLIQLDPKTTSGNSKEFNIKLKQISEDHQVSTRQLRRWVDLAREDPSKGLIPKYQGNTQFHNPQYQDFNKIVDRAVAIRVANPAITVDCLIEKLNQEFNKAEGFIKRSTLQRHLQQRNVSKRDLALEQAYRNGDFYNRFEMDRCLELVQGDLKYLPKCLNDENKLVKTYFVAWIDDKSRYILSAGVFTSQEQYVVSTTLRSAVERFGRIEALYMDNGSIYRNRTCHFAAKILDIKPIHTLVRHSWAKGKIERLNKNLDQECRNIIDSGKTLSVTAMVKNVENWVDTYNHTVHSAIGKTPAEAFFSEWNEETATFYPEEIIETAFLDTITRKVCKDGTVKYKNTSYIIPLQEAKIGSKVELAIARNGIETEVSLIKDNLDLEPLKKLEVTSKPNRALERRKFKLTNPIPEPKPEDRGAALKMDVMHLLKKHDYNFDFGKRNDLLDFAYECYIKTGNIHYTAQCLKAKLNTNSSDQNEVKEKKSSNSTSQAGYLCLLNQQIKGDKE